MTVLAGLWRFSDQSGLPDIARAVSSMIRVQQGCEQDAVHRQGSVQISGRTAFGSSDWPDLSRQRSDARRDSYHPAGMLLAMDARIDNRSDLHDRLGLARDEPIDDESLVFLAYRQWGDRLVDHLVGDYALAFWDSSEQVMTLVRDPTGQRPLHYHLGNGFVAFASMPQGLHGLDNVRPALNASRLSEFVAAVPQRGPETFFQGVSRVEPAQIVKITPGGVRADRYWNMPTSELRYRNPDDYTQAFREVLDRATQARLHGAGEVVAAHLSAGLDSSAVASTAARLAAATGGRVLAVTSAPRMAFVGPVPHGRIADESELAAGLAAQYANMDHIVLRSSGVSPLSLLAGDSLLFAQPVGYPCNNVWWRQANEAARSRGATVMLTGEMGNLTISAGGLGVLAEYVRAGRFAAWLREVIALERGGPRWRGLLAASFGPWLPTALLESLRRFAAGGKSAALETLLTDEYRALASAAATRRGQGEARHTERETRWDMLAASDPGTFRKGALLEWGIEERDPTADRRLVEFCFSLPPEQLVGGGRTRRLARIALADRVPAAILDGPRGYQFADWYESLDQPGLAEAARRIAASPVAAQVIDIGAVNRLIAAWPVGNWASAGTIGTYRVGLLRALSAGIFALKAGQ